MSHSSTVAQPPPPVPGAMEIEGVWIVRTSKRKEPKYPSWAEQQLRDPGPKSCPKSYKDAAMRSPEQRPLQLGDFVSSNSLSSLSMGLITE